MGHWRNGAKDKWKKLHAVWGCGLKKIWSLLQCSVQEQKEKTACKKEIEKGY